MLITAVIDNKMSDGNFDVNDVEVQNNELASQFEMKVGDEVAFAAYKMGKDTITFTHTIVPEAFEGQGVGGKLAVTALDYARDNDLKVIPLCPFISAYIRSHEEYQPLLLGYQA